ncbi:MAG: replication-associated recombination protein A [Actinobacteria bacterium]|nr:replication-associated recombination protein A [Actinomycetota bacterium]MCL5886418.1 replication-associated recombination protein A [Actinomycetota bacterium]
MQSLFDQQASSILVAQAPLADQLRPRTLDEMVDQQHLVGVGAPLRKLIESDKPASILLWGPPGTGKTTVVSILASTTQRAFTSLSATSSGVRDVRQAIDAAKERLGYESRGTILFVDEIHRFSSTQQDSLLDAVEKGVISLVAATTENPYFSVVPPLLSRMTLFRFKPLSQEALTDLAYRALQRLQADCDEEALDLLLAVANGDARAALGVLEVAASIYEPEEAHSMTPAKVHINSALIHEAAGARYAHGGRDSHYDEASAFIKSIRGSDTDAGLFWLARMLDRGEDPRFIARRLVILASEDVGLADPNALSIAVAAAHAVELVGLPEAQLNLAEAVIYLARAPKSNRVTTALAKASQDVKSLAASGSQGEVPLHLRGTGYKGASRLGHGEGYRYPHNFEGGVVEQQYRPPGAEGHVYYEPSGYGEET